MDHECGTEPVHLRGDPTHPGLGCFEGVPVTLPCVYGLPGLQIYVADSRVTYDHLRNVITMMIKGARSYILLSWLP